MDTLSTSLAMILPESLFGKARETIDELALDIPLYSASMSGAVTIARELERNQFQGLIVRGGTDYLLDENGHLSPSR